LTVPPVFAAVVWLDPDEPAELDGLDELDELPHAASATVANIASKPVMTDRGCLLTAPPPRGLFFSSIYSALRRLWLVRDYA
jgi:hypothetical protein